MDVIIAWYSFSRIPFVIPRKGMKQLINQHMVHWSRHLNEWSILVSEATIKKYRGEEY